jgi:hypothetical protein
LLKLPWFSASDAGAAALFSNMFFSHSLYSNRFVFLQYALDASIAQTISKSSFSHAFILKVLTKHFPLVFEWKLHGQVQYISLS